MVSTTIPFDPHMRKPENPKGLVLLLHGYDQMGSYMQAKLDKFIPSDWAYISPNAPFPIPHWDSVFPAPGWREQGLKLGYTWYFYQSKTREYYLDMRTTLEFLACGVRDLGFGDLPKIVVGFSQGGYVAPFVAQKLTRVRQVVCLSSEFIPDELPDGLEFSLDGVFGDSDPIADIEAAKRSHGECLAKGIKGEFHTVAGAAHEVSAAIGEKLKQILKV
ncbi:MAG: hypothetical protein ABL958_16680 [Bdellovibrionia bacterium]